MCQQHADWARKQRSDSEPLDQPCCSPYVLPHRNQLQAHTQQQQQQQQQEQQQQQQEQQQQQQPQQRESCCY
jgi:hypothetical protein